MLRHSAHSSSSVSWELWSRPPAPALGPHVLGYVGYRERVHGAPFRRLETPSDEVHVILSFGPAIRAERRGAALVRRGARHRARGRRVARGRAALRGDQALAARRAAGPRRADGRAGLPDRAVRGRLGRRRADRAPRRRCRRGRRASTCSTRCSRSASPPRRPLAPEVESAWWRLVATAGAVPVGRARARRGLEPAALHRPLRRRGGPAAEGVRARAALRPREGPARRRAADARRPRAASAATTTRPTSTATSAPSPAARRRSSSRAGCPPVRGGAAGHIRPRRAARRGLASRA